MNMIRNKGVSMLGVSMIVLTMGTASLAKVRPDQSDQSISNPVDIEAIARGFEKEAEYLDAIRYGVASPVSVGEIVLQLTDTGQRAVAVQIENAKHELQENIQQHVGVTATDLAFDSYEIKTNSPEKIQADFKYYATREVGDGGNISTWKEEVVYGIEIDPKTGQITDVVNKDLNWIHANIPDEEVVVDDGLGSDDEGISSEEMKKLDHQSALHAKDDVIPYGMDYYQRQQVKRYARKWWNGRNRDYPSYKNDCTNFASQALQYGGWPMVFGAKRINKNWWAKKTDNSWAWSGAENFYKFSIHHAKRSVLHHQQDTKYLREGDIVQFKEPGKKQMSHTMVVTGIDHRGVLVSYHSTDNLDQPLRDLFTPGRIWYPHKLK